MTFCQQVVATLIGTVSGFMLSIVLYWIKEKWNTSKANSFIVENAKVELEIGISILEKTKKEIISAIEKVTVSDINVYVNINYNRMERHFLIQLYNSGLMKKKLFSVEDINLLNRIYIDFAEGREAQLKSALDLYRKRIFTSQMMINSLKCECVLVEQCITDLTKFKKKMVHYMKNVSKLLS